MEVIGPVYVISMPPHQMLVNPADLDELRVAVRHAIEATNLDPRKVGKASVTHDPFVFAFSAVTRADVKPHWAGTLTYAGQELPLFRWDGVGTLYDLHEALYSREYVAQVFAGLIPVPAYAMQSEVVYHE